MKRLLKDEFLKKSTILFAGMMVGHVFNYLFQVSMGRLLSVQTYGEMNALLSTMMIFGIPFMTITNYLAKKVSHYNALGYSKQANELIVKSYRNVFVVGLIIMIVSGGFIGYVREYLRMASVIPILLLFLCVLVSILIPLNTGILQGLHKFRMLAFMAGGFGITKCLMCVVLVLAGLGLNGIMLSIILSVLCVGYISFRPIKQHLMIGRESLGQGIGYSMPNIVPIFLANFTFAVMVQVDVIMVKHFFTPQEAGVYSSAAIIGKAVMYLPGAIVMALFPMVASNQARNESTLHLLVKAMSITLLLSGGGAIVAYLFPDIIVSTFFGERYAPASRILGLFALAMLPCAIIMVVMNYNLARGNKFFAYLMPVFAVLKIIGIISFHDKLTSVLMVVLCTGTLCVAMLFLLLTLDYCRHRLYFKK
jgi:O-antigen/teichoic acid export membrane protein